MKTQYLLNYKIQLIIICCFTFSCLQTSNGQIKHDITLEPLSPIVAKLVNKDVIPNRIPKSSISEPLIKDELSTSTKALEQDITTIQAENEIELEDWMQKPFGPYDQEKGIPQHNFSKRPNKI